MFRKFHERLKDHEEGFTLIELLVVILIIAILAAIAIPVFLRQREKGWVSQSQSALKNAATAAESYATGANGSYAALTSATLTSEGFKKANSVNLTTVTGNANYFCIGVTHADLPSDHAWKNAHYISSVGEPKVGTCPTLPTT